MLTCPLRLSEETLPGVRPKPDPVFSPKWQRILKISGHQNQKKLQKCPQSRPSKNSPNKSSNLHGHKQTIYKAWLHTFLICDLKPLSKVLSPTSKMLKLRTEKIRFTQGHTPNLTEAESWWPNFLTLEALFSLHYKMDSSDHFLLQTKDADPELERLAQVSFQSWHLI